MNRNRSLLCALMLAVLSVACGTTLEVGEGPRGIASPEGMVVNRRVTYTGSFDMNIPGVGRRSGELKPLAAVDAWRVLVVNISRMLFADGDLVLVLDENQLFKKVEVKSTAGAEAAANTGTAILEAATDDDDEDG